MRTSRAFWLTEVGFPVLLLGLCLALFLILVRPAHDRLHQARQECERLDDGGGPDMELVAHREAVTGDIELLRTALERLDAAIPPVSGTYGFLQELERLSREERLVLDQVVPGNLEVGARIASLPVHIRTSGSFHRLLRFLARIESCARLVRLEGLSFTPRQGSTDMQLEATFQVFCIPEPAPAAEGPS